VTLIEGNPGDGVPGPAARVLRLDVRETPLSGLTRTLGLAPVVADKTVTEGAATGDRGNTIANTVDAEVGHGAVATAATRHLAARDDSNGAELIGSSTCQGVGHGTAEAEADRKALVLIDAETLLNVGDDGIDEVDVGASAVAPTVAVTLRCNKDGRVVSKALKAVVVPDTLLDSTSGVNISHGTAKPVKAEDETVGAAGVVIVGEPDGKLASVYGVCAAVETSRPSAAGRVAATSGRRTAASRRGGSGRRITSRGEALRVPLVLSLARRTRDARCWTCPSLTTT